MPADNDNHPKGGDVHIHMGAVGKDPKLSELDALINKVRAFMGETFPGAHFAALLHLHPDSPGYAHLREQILAEAKAAGMENPDNTVFAPVVIITETDGANTNEIAAMGNTAHMVFHDLYRRRLQRDVLEATPPAGNA